MSKPRAACCIIYARLRVTMPVIIKHMPISLILFKSSESSLRL
ncbi:hypothetical protein [Alkaliphilus crotonatoxidans]